MGYRVTNTVPDEFAVTLVANTAKSAAYLGTKAWLEGLGDADTAASAGSAESLNWRGLR
jgi:hypothetical protein